MEWIREAGVWVVAGAFMAGMFFGAFMLFVYCLLTVAKGKDTDGTEEA